MISWIASLQGTAVMLGAACLMGWGWLKFVHDPKVATKVETKIVERSEKQGARNAAAAKKAIDSARKPGALDRLRQDPATCPDCGK